MQWSEWGRHIREIKVNGRCIYHCFHLSVLLMFYLNSILYYTARDKTEFEFIICFSNITQMFIYLWHSMTWGETSVCHIWKHKTYSCFKHAHIMFVTSVIISCTFCILWRWCLIAVLNSCMSQVLMQFGNQYVQLAGCGAI